MSLYQDASLAMIPSAVKDGKLYSIRPTDGSGDFTFSRGTTATRLNASGLIEKGRENLLLQSNTFDVSANWVNTNTTETGGQSGYDGSSDAWLLTKTAANGRVYQSVSTSGVQTFSLYAKANDSNWISLWTNVGTSYFDLVNGTKGSTTASTTIGSEMVSVGNGWYRCSLIFNTSIINVRIYPADGDLDTSGTSGSIYIQDAQLEQGLVATDYIETTTTSVQVGITDDLPRLDYSGGASCPSLLLEPQRTNLVTQSEYLDSHTKNAFTLVNFSNVTCPIEGVKVSQIIDSNSGGNGRLALYETINLTASTTYTASIFAKADQLNFIYFSFEGTSVNLDKRVWFNLSTGQVGTESGGATGSIESFGDGWYRCIMVFTTDNTGVITTKVAPAEEDNNINVDRDGTSSVFATAMQFELGSYPTSYIPTYGASVTRNGELYQKTSATDIIGQNKGSIYLEITQNGLPSYTQRILSISDGTSNNNFEFQLTPSNVITFAAVADGVSSAIISKSSATTEGVKLKIAVGYAENDFVLYIDGVQVGTDNSGAVPSTSVIKNNRPTGGTLFVGEVHQVLLYKTRLTNGELAALTTL